MAWTPPTNPEECYELSPFGFGSFPEPGQSVDVCLPHPFGGGFGGVGFLAQAEDAGGTPYGLGSYGSRWFSRPRLNISGGYGGDPYGLGGYGGTEVTPPFISSAISLNGFEVELFFSEEVDSGNAALTDPASYSLEPIFGAAPATILSVHIEKVGEANAHAGDYIAGVVSVVIRHTGTTLGGQYKVHATDLTDISGNPIVDADVPFLAKGEPPAVALSIPQPDTGDKLLVTFSQPMLRSADEPGTGPGISDAGSYVFEADYPIDLTPTAVEHDAADSKLVHLTVKGMTSLEYEATVGPAFAFSYDTADGIQQATRVDSGTGTISEGASYLLLARERNNALGVSFQDQSGSITPLNSTLRADCTFDFSQAQFAPALSVFPEPEVADIVVEDGPPGNGLRVIFTLKRNSAGDDQVRIRSGTFDVTVDADWSGGVRTLSFVRNMKAGTVTFLLDGTPLTTSLISNVDGASLTQAGISFNLLSAEWSVNTVRLHSVRCSSSLTVFSEAWNFLHDQVATFTGSSVLARDRFKTIRGPLVKGWGDATPATEQDVEVRVNGEEVAVSEVNPYIGEIVLEVPIPLLPEDDPQARVAADYKWFKNPVMEMAGLNTPGLVLNKFDCPSGHHDPTIDDGLGAVDIARFPYSVVLGPMDRKKPVFIGHRYMGYERAYSALINSPTTLLLNQAPGRASVPGFDREVSGVSVAYEGLVEPVNASPAWALSGEDFGGVDHDADLGVDLGTFTVIDAESGPYDPNAPTTAFYHRGVDLSYPSSANVVVRFQTEDGNLFDEAHPETGAPDKTVAEAHGVFTGVAFGIHDTRYLYLCGCLRINDVEHVGLLLDPKRLHEYTAWDIGPKGTMMASSQTRGTMPTALVPEGFEDGARFQILDGPQVGVYTTTDVTRQSDGTTTMDFTPPLPQPWGRWGNKYPVVVFETRHSDKPFTYRFDIDMDQQVAELRISGETRGVVASIDGNSPALPAPAASPLYFTPEIVGQMFWGSVSRMATSRSTWSFARYGVVPDAVFQQGHAVVINTEMSDLPEDNPLDSGGGVWSPFSGRGDSLIVENEDTLLLKNVAAFSDQFFANGYYRIEPFFQPDSILDVRAKVRMDSGTAGAGDFEVQLDDTDRFVKVVSILYEEGGSNPYSYRRIIRLPQASAVGISEPETFGWSKPLGSTIQAEFEGSQMVTRQNSAARGVWETTLSAEDQVPSTDEGRVLEAKLELVASTVNANGDSGVVFACEQAAVGLGYALVMVEVTPTEVRLRTGSGIVQSYPHSPNGPHIYRVLTDRIADTVTLLIDDEVQSPSVALSAFSGGAAGDVVFFGATGRDIDNQFDDTITSTVEWYYIHGHTKAPASAKRTLGVLKNRFAGSVGASGIDPYDIDNYELPRTDTSTAPNSWQSGPAIEEMDWRQDMEIRVYRDPGWGVTVYRPDLPLPPYYQPEDGTAGKGFITESTEPSAGWINVEYQRLPRPEDLTLGADFTGSRLGRVGFGSISPHSISQTQWDWVRYRLFRHPTEDRIAPEHMVLNQYNVVTSGEPTQDRGLEKVAIETMDRTRLTLRPTHLYAKSVYKVIDGTTIWTSEHYTFDRASQVLTLVPDSTTGEVRQFSADHASVTVMFVAGDPVTNTYLEQHPLLDGVTLLNEGTPPVPKSQTAESEIEIVSGSVLNDPSDVLNDDPDFVLNDPHKTLRHKNVEGSLYESLDFIEVKDDGDEGLIASICERGPGQGFSGLAEEEGEDIYSPDGTGDDLGGVGNVQGHKATGDKVGRAVGAEVFALSGTMFTEQNAGAPKNSDFPQGGGSPGSILFASGGSFLNPTADAEGNIIPGGFVAAGGHLGPGSAVLWPSFPSKGAVGGDQGRIYKRTDWFMRLRSVLGVAAADSAGSAGDSPGSAGDSPGSAGDSAGSAGGSGLTDIPLEEVFSLDGADRTAPSGPAHWVTNPAGAQHNLGAAFGLMSGAGDYSRFGPWGGLDSLSPRRDSGFFVEGSPVDGSQVRVWDRVGLVWVTFTARAVPLTSTEFLLGPTSHISLAAAINAHPVLRTQYTATPGLTLSGDLKVEVTALEPVTSSDPAYIGTLDASAYRLQSVIPYPGSSGLLIGGAGITQSSLLAGGGQTTNADDIHEPKRGMVLQGGAALPVGAEVKLTFTPA